MNPSTHRQSSWGQIIAQLLSIGVAALIATVGITHWHNSPLVFVWRWYAVLIILAIAATVTTVVFLVRQSPYRKGPFYWFLALNMANALLLLIILAQVLSATPEAAAFWQGMLPMGWIPIPMLLVFFAVTYVEDSDLPKNLGLWGTLLVTAVVLLFFAGLTNLIESHVPKDMALNLWGWQSEPGDFEWVPYVWAFALTLVALSTLVGAYRRAVDVRTHRQLKIFIIALTQYMAIALFFDFGLWFLFPNASPPLSFLYFTMLSAIIGYGISRYGLFQITPTTLATSILENLSEAVLGVNSELKVEFANQGAQAIFGRKRGDLRGMPLSGLLREGDLKQGLSGLNQSLGAYTLEDAFVQPPSGGIVPVIINLSWALNEQGQHVGYILAVQNVTELRKKTVELAKEKASVELKVTERTRELHEERARLRASIDSLALGFLLVDNQNQLVLQNQALQRVLGLKKSASRLTEVAKAMGHFDLAARCEAARLNPRSHRTQEVMVGSRVVKVFLAPVLLTDEPQAAALGTVVLMEDVTEAKVLERSRDEFFSIASHELRTPLTAIRGNASMLQQFYAKDLVDQDAREMVTDIESSSKRLIEIVNDFLDMSRLEQGKLAFKLAPTPIEPLIERMAYELKGVLNEKHLAFNFDTKVLGALPPLWADEARLQQILYNLVGNAVKFTEAGSIDLTTEVVRGRNLKITVHDTGRGISLKSQKLLFRKFQQAGDSLLTRDTTRGTGLGLYISRLIAEQMGGRLVLESSEEGQGSTFSVTLPLATKEQLHQQVNHMQTVDTATGLTAP